MTTGRIELSLGPLLFKWSPQQVRDFYALMADECPLDQVYLGEVVCGKRAPLLGDALAEAGERLTRAGKTVVWSTLAMPGTPREQRELAGLAAGAGRVELNDISGLVHLRPGATFVAGPFLNVYNEAAARELQRRGCVRLCANVELSLSDIATIAAACPELAFEVFAYGRLPLAISGRCYHARAHALHKDGCQFVCEHDPDGRAVHTVEGAPFLAINGVQILSHGVQIADEPLDVLRASGVRALRLSPHTGDMRAVIAAFRRFADGDFGAEGLRSAVESASPPGALVSGYLRGAPGIAPARGS